MNTFWWFSLFSLLFLTATGQESVEFLHLHDSTLKFQASSQNALPKAVQVENEHLNNVSKSIVMAETWVRAHVLAFYPAINITTIIVGNTVLCNKYQELNLGSILPSINNIYHTLTRWGLQNHIKVATSFSPGCLDSKSEAYIKPLLNTLQEIGSPYVLNTFPDEDFILLETHSKSMKKLGFFHQKMVKIINSPKQEKPTSRKLSYIDLSNIIPPKPTPIATAISPLPPLVGTISSPPSYSIPFPPSISPPYLPHYAPMGNPVSASPPYGPHLPPCEPSGASPPVGGVHHGVWCVAKPSVPSDTLQEALDYACGDGGADCEAITPDGSCYMPDSLVAHASYAFNSYWQKSKRNGGTCGFGGTAMLVTSDPSYRHCRFVLA